MKIYIFFNGDFYPEKTPLLSILDRGLCFGDGLFELIRCIKGRFLLFSKHIKRMRDSATFLEIPFPYGENELLNAAKELTRRNKIKDGELYIEITRGEAPRYHQFPKKTEPNFFLVLNPLREMPEECWARGVKVITFPDIRWGYCHLKTINLLPNVLAKEMAKNSNAYEAFFTREDKKGTYLTEGSSSSIFAIKNGFLMTSELDNILPGTTRAAVIEIAMKRKISVKETRLYLKEFIESDEAFLTSTVSEVMPVIKINDRLIASGMIGDLTLKLQSEYKKFIKEHLEW
ncbi:MAG: aminotransferase class IV [Candidatus Cloacimonadota bacterium]|nr:MAG: aminotransferase class IV [Candidatus Cloacimonadota bacterium]